MKIFDYNTQPQFNLDWLVLKVNSSVAEDFSDATLKVWLMSNDNAYPLTITVANGHITADINARFSSGKLPIGTYGFKAVWAKNERRPRNVFPHGDIICTERYEVFGISNIPSEVTETTTSEDEVVIKFSTHTASYGEDGLSAYELAVMKGLTTDDETTYVSGVELQSNKISAWGSSPTNTQYPSAKLVKDDLDVLTSGVSAASASITALQSGKEDKSNKVTYISNNVTHTQYPSALAVKNKLDAKADLEGGKVPASQLPSYVDDIVEFSTNVPQSRWRNICVVDHIVSALPSEPTSGDIYFLTEDDSSWGYYAGIYLCTRTGFNILSVNSESLIIQKGTQRNVSANDNIGWFYERDWYDLRQKTFADFFGTVTSSTAYIYFQDLDSNGTAVITKDGYNVSVTKVSSGKYNVSVSIKSDLTDLQRGKIYLNTYTNNTYRWSGDTMVNVTSMDLVTTTSDGLMRHDDKAKLDRYPSTPNYEATANKVTAFSNPTDTQYPSAKLVKDSLDLKEDADKFFFSTIKIDEIVNRTITNYERIGLYSNGINKQCFIKKIDTEGVIPVTMYYIGQGRVEFSFIYLKDVYYVYLSENAGLTDVIYEKQSLFRLFGTTSERPTTDLYAGMMYYDTTLGKPIWYTGTGQGSSAIWADAMGNQV